MRRYKPPTYMVPYRQNTAAGTNASIWDPDNQNCQNAAASNLSSMSVCQNAAAGSNPLYIGPDCQFARTRQQGVLLLDPIYMIPTPERGGRRSVLSIGRPYIYGTHLLSPVMGLGVVLTYMCRTAMPHAVAGEAQSLQSLFRWALLILSHRSAQLYNMVCSTSSSYSSAQLYNIWLARAGGIFFLWAL